MKYVFSEFSDFEKKYFEIKSTTFSIKIDEYLDGVVLGFPPLLLAILDPNYRNLRKICCFCTEIPFLKKPRSEKFVFIIQ
jgi:hypothetical protein